MLDTVTHRDAVPAQRAEERPRVIQPPITGTHRSVWRVAALVWQASLLTDDLELMNLLATLHLGVVELLPAGQVVPLADHPGVDRHTTVHGCLEEAAALALDWDTRDLAEGAAERLLEIVRRRDLAGP